MISSSPTPSGIAPDAERPAHARPHDRSRERDSDGLLALPPGELVPFLREALARGSGVWVRVHGASMTPAIPRRAMVRLEPVPPGSLRKGDVVLALLPSRLPVLHRIAAVTARDLVLRGDALGPYDPPVQEGDVLARATRVRTSEGEHDVPPPGRRPWLRVAYAWWRRVRHGEPI